MPNAPLRIAVITGSTRDGRFGRRRRLDRDPGATAARHAGSTPIDLAHAGLRPVHPDGADPAERLYVERIEQADGFVVVTPEYNHGYPAALKQAIDLPRPSGTPSRSRSCPTAGIAGGLRAVEQLRLVFAELHATTIRDTVSFHNCTGCFDDAGQPIDPTGTDGGRHDDARPARLVGHRPPHRPRPPTSPPAKPPDTLPTPQPFWRSDLSHLQPIRPPKRGVSGR